ncbi:WAT1-related protein At2g37450-like isoform X3 [Durio zibethinus]|uniref:WAT1-related protein n=1 Tax=Durio zibethinus TaxID=66656 RepID=A0A6P5Z2Q8_DURZI|nr:WAT1-related protein At2g37450-like isoform X3 [Durio zibethinus]
MENQGHGSLGKFKPFFAALFLQAGFAGMDILSKAALNQGMSNYALVVYRHAIATVIMAPFAAILDKLEKVNVRSIRSHGKVIGTLATVAGAMVMTLMKGPVLELFWTKGRINHHAAAKNGTDFHDTIKGGLMITVGCFSYACFVILQAVTLEAYPAELSLTVWICLLGTFEGTIAALIMEKGNGAIWAIKWDTKLLTAAYSGIVCSGLAYYMQGVIMKDRGPVFVTAFSPLCMVIVAIVASFILAEQMYLGRVIGAIIIIVGLYFVLWGKGKDYKSPPPLMEQQIEPDKTGRANNENDSSDHQAITIDAASRETSIGDEKEQEKSNSISV